MRESTMMIVSLVGTMMLLFFGLAFLFVGRGLYGSDASLLWASGILTYMGIKGLAEFCLYLKSKYAKVRNG